MQTLTPPPTNPALAARETVARLRGSFDSGRTRPLEWRRVQLERMRSMLERHEPEILAALATDLGKPAIEGWGAEIAIARHEIDYALDHLDDWSKPQRASLPLTQRPGHARLVAEPLGVVLVIAPWNYPLQLLLAPMVGALAAGNCVLAKPSEVSAATSAVIARLLPKYVDPECVAVVEGGAPETTEILAQRFDHILYTGNGKVGRIVMEAAARHLTPVTLELGGKSPAIVLDDARLGVAARRIAWGKFFNAGQTCVAPDYVLVQRGVADELVDGIAEAVREFYGADPQASPDYARIVNDRHFERLTRLLGSGTAVIGGANDAATRYFAPTVLTHVDPGAPVMQEEIFGPILPIIPVEDVDEAVTFVVARDKPLALYVFSESSEHQREITERTSSGGVCVNHTLLQFGVPSLPVGGVGPSGMGSYHGKAGFDTFTHYKPMLHKPSRPDPKLAYPPYTARKEKILRRLL